MVCGKLSKEQNWNPNNLPSNEAIYYLNGAIHYLELFLQRPLQWSICMLHLNELALRHTFTTLDGSTKSPDKSTGPIGYMLNGVVS